MPPNTRLEEPTTGAGMTRRFMLGSLAATSVARAQSKAPSRPKTNFLFILADDHAGYVISCDGNRLATTPNMDRLAAQGTRFSTHHCNSPVCTPSRQSFFTGQLPHAAGVTLLGTPLAADKPTLAKQFKKAGYQTSVFGKMHFNRPAESGLHGFDVMLPVGAARKARHAEVKPKPIPEDVRKKPATWKPFQDPARIWLNRDKLPYARYRLEEHTSEPQSLR